MKKTVGFIFTLILVVMFSSIAPVKAETYVKGIKDYADTYTKKKPKREKKHRKNKKNKKKDLGAIKVVSASSLFTKKIDDLSKIDYQKAVNSVLRPNNSYIERLSFFDKFVTDSNMGIVRLANAEDTINFVTYSFNNYKFGFIDSDNLSMIEVPDYEDERANAAFAKVGLNISISKKVLKGVVHNNESYTFKIGDADWVLKEGYGGTLMIERVIKPIHIYFREAYKALVQGRLELHPSFYNHFLTFLNTTDILEDNKSGKLGVGFIDSNFMDESDLGEGMIYNLYFADLKEDGVTELRTAGHVKGETAVADLTRILKDYYDIDFTEFDTSRINKIVENGVVNWEPVVYTKDFGRNKLTIEVKFGDERGYHFSIEAEIHNDK